MTVEMLYKYGSLNEYSEATFSTPTIWFASPTSLNDPFECRPWFTFDGQRDEIVEALTRMLRRNNPGLPPYEATARAVAIFLEGRHQDPAIWEAIRMDVLTALGSQIGLCCLSAHNDSILMWAHYAQEHRGYCLGFEATDSTPFFGEAQEVDYADDYPVVDFFRTPHAEQVDLIFLTKFSGWSYEGEYRIIDHANGPGLHAYPAKLLRSITFGFRMPESDRTKIQEWVGRRGHDVKLFEAVRDDRQFKIDVREVGGR
jgi:hypothetical protein